MAFQHKFTQDLGSAKKELQGNIDQLNKQTTDNFAHKESQITELRNDLTEESKNRNSQFEEGQKETNRRLDSI